MHPAIDNETLYMTIFKNIISSKIKRKNFLIITVVSVIGVFSIFKNPFKLFSKKNNPDVSKPDNLTVKINSSAVKRNKNMING